MNERTTWRIRSIENEATGQRHGFDLPITIDTTDPTVLALIERAAADHGVELERVAGGDPRFGEPVGENEIAGLAVAFKALVVRAGGSVEITEGELLHARTLLARVDADPQVMRVELVDGDPPDTPRFAAEAER